MSNDAAILGRAIRAVIGTCRVCGCSGDTCSIGGGEKCFWMTTNPEKTLCSHPRCIQADAIQRKKIERERAQAAARISSVPSWLKQRRERDRKHKSKAKGRVR